MADRFTVPQRAAEGVLAELPGDVAALSSQYLPFAWAETQYPGQDLRAAVRHRRARALVQQGPDHGRRPGSRPAGHRQGRRRRSRPSPRSPTRSTRRTPAATTTSWAGCPAGPGAGGNAWRLRPGLALHVGLRLRRQVRRPGRTARSRRPIRASSPATSSCTTGPRPTIRRPSARWVTHQPASEPAGRPEPVLDRQAGHDDQR